jgi:SprB repeat
MKKIFFSFLFSGFCMLGFAQQVQYEIQVNFGVKSSLNNVQCYSAVILTFSHLSGTKSTWYQGFNMNQNDWRYFSKTFNFSVNDRVVGIDCYATRVIDQNVGGCKTLGGGSITLPVPSYPCYYDRKYGIPGYDGDTYIDITIKPLTSVFVIQTEGKMVAQRDLKAIGYGVSLKYSNGVVEPVGGSIYETDISNNTNFISRQAILKSDKSVLVKEIQVRTVYYYFEGFFPRITDQTQIYPVTDLGGNFETILNNPFYDTGFGGSLRIFYGKVNTPIILPKEGTPPTVITQLPAENNITLEIPELIPENYKGYSWLYNIDGQTKTEAYNCRQECTTYGTPPYTYTSCNQVCDYRTVPDYLPFTGFGSTNKVTISGQLLLGVNYKNYFFENIFIKANYCGRDTEIITLRHVPSAPNIISVLPTPETCFGSQDAKLKVNFDRPLYAGTLPDGTSYNETLTIFLKKPTDVFPISKINYPSTLELDNSLTVTDTDLSPNNYTVSLQNGFGGLGRGYSDGPNHTKSATILPRLPITNFTATKSDAHCFAGQDGLITVSAQGGTSAYTAYLKQASTDLATISLTQATNNRFTDLAAGTYNVTLKDSNGCDPKDGSGNVIILSPIVGQPAKTVAISAVENVEPLGFGLTNGHVTVRSVDGTTPHTFFWTDSNNTPLVADASVIETPTSTLSKLSNIGKGIYHVRTQDKNFALASPAIEINQRGCYDTLTVEVTQPPLLEVAMAEKRYVSCYGFKDGELVATATGGRPYASATTFFPYRYEWFVVNGSVLTPFDVSENKNTATDRFSATYRVKVTDKNGIIAWSPDFELIQPDPLLIDFNTSELLCNGDKNGTSIALPRGGTAPYTYSWSTDDRTNSVANLTDGWYSVVITDQRRCTTFAQTEVKVPDGLAVDPKIKQPTCNNYSDGTITLNVSGGKTAYIYEWKHGAQTDFVQSLGQGQYQVKITDANKCFLIRDFTLDNPGLLPVNLGADRVLCKDQTLEINGAVDDPVAVYAWTKNGASFSSSPIATLSDAGTYQLLVTDSKGCSNKDDITIGRDGTEIAADFVVATRLPRREVVRIANISHPAPDNVAWIIPTEATVKNERPELLELIFADYGEYTIGLRSTKGACEKIQTKKVRVVTKDELADYQAPDEPYIKQFSVSPNPNQGKFSAIVELREVGDIKLIFYTGQGILLAEKDIKGQSFITTDFDVSSSVSSGVYLLQLITKQGLASFKVLIK